MVRSLEIVITLHDEFRGGGVLGLFFAGHVPAGLSEPLPHYSLFCGQVIDAILVTFGQIHNFSRSQLSHFLFMYVPYIE